MKEAMQQALNALESCKPADTSTGHVCWPSFDEGAVDKAITALRAALAAPSVTYGSISERAAEGKDAGLWEVAAPQPEPGAVYNPWRESSENCISGDNYLRASEYLSLIEDLDDLYRLRAVPTAPQGESHDLRKALHRISLASQNSMSSKEECGRIARDALHDVATLPAAPSVLVADAAGAEREPPK